MISNSRMDAVVIMNNNIDRSYSSINSSSFRSSHIIIVRTTNIPKKYSIQRSSSKRNSRFVGWICSLYIISCSLVPVIVAFASLSPSQSTSTTFRHHRLVSTNTALLLAKTTTTTGGGETTIVDKKNIIMSATAAVSRTSNEEFVMNLPMDQLTKTANSYASAHGILVESISVKKPPDTSGTSVDVVNESIFQCAPISLLPNTFPKSEFEYAIELMPYYNLLVDKISRDSHFLHTTLSGPVADADPFTAKLLQLYTEIYVNNDQTSYPNYARIADCLGIHRSDYMLSKNMDSKDEYHIKQIELNTIAASFGALSCKVSELHRYLLTRYAAASSPNNNNKVNPIQEYIRTNTMAIGCGKDDDDATTTTENGIEKGVPVNMALQKVPAAMNIAVQRYIQRFLKDGTNHQQEQEKNMIILFVVQDGERNTVDQRLLEFQLWDEYQLPVLRLTLAQIYERVQLHSDTGKVTIQLNENSDTEDPTEIPLVYYRAGYAPTDYPSGYDHTTGVEWLARERLERSRATKCPSLGYHLAGTKKVQQELARPGVLEQFFPSNHDNDENEIIVQKLRRSFAGLYSLNEKDMTIDDKKAVQQILATDTGRDLFVLKPQREGGGYNFYGTDMYNKLKENIDIIVDDSNGEKSIQMKNPLLGEYILMERLFPPEQHGILLRNGRIEGMGNTISELGCYGCIVSSFDGTNILHNEYAGYLLRTKFTQVNEGGVASGFATLSSPYLC